jgi:hypothetical protein
LVGLAYCLSVVAATNLVDRRDVVRHILVQLRRASLNRLFLIDNRRKCFVLNIDQAHGVIGYSLSLSHDQRYALADKTNAIDGNDRPLWHFGARHDPVRNNRTDLPDEIGARHGQANARRCLGGREINALHDGVGVRRS